MKNKLYAARDIDGSLYLYSQKPVPGSAMYINAPALCLNDDLFPNLRFEDGPIEVEITSKSVMDVRYQYKTLKSDGLVDASAFTNLGKQGWKLTTIVPENGFYYYYFIKPI